jgi:hypothetical protein
MPGTLLGLQRRLIRVEQIFAAIAERNALAKCACVDETFINTADELEAEMDRACPVHGFRSLGEIERIFYVKPDRTIVKDPKLERLLEIYEERRARQSSGRATSRRHLNSHEAEEF